LQQLASPLRDLTYHVGLITQSLARWDPGLCGLRTLEPLCEMAVFVQLNNESFILCMIY